MVCNGVGLSKYWSMDHIKIYHVLLDERGSGENETDVRQMNLSFSFINFLRNGLCLQ